MFSEPTSDVEKIRLDNHSRFAWYLDFTAIDAKKVQTLRYASFEQPVALMIAAQF